MWVTWKSSGNGMILVYRYAVYRVCSEYRESGYGIVGEGILTLYRAVNCLHMPMSS